MKRGKRGAREQRGNAKQGKGPRAARLQTEYNYSTCVFNLNLKSNSDTSALGESSLASGNQIADIGLGVHLIRSSSDILSIFNLVGLRADESSLLLTLVLLQN